MVNNSEIGGEVAGKRLILEVNLSEDYAETFAELNIDTRFDPEAMWLLASESSIKEVSVASAKELLSIRGMVEGYYGMKYMFGNDDSAEKLESVEVFRRDLKDSPIQLAHTLAEIVPDCIAEVPEEYLLLDPPIDMNSDEYVVSTLTKRHLRNLMRVDRGLIGSEYMTKEMKDALFVTYIESCEKLLPEDGIEQIQRILLDSGIERPYRLAALQSIKPVAVEQIEKSVVSISNTSDYVSTAGLGQVINIISKERTEDSCVIVSNAVALLEENAPEGRHYVGSENVLIISNSILDSVLRYKFMNRNLFSRPELAECEITNNTDRSAVDWFMKETISLLERGQIDEKTVEYIEERCKRMSLLYKSKLDLRHSIEDSLVKLGVKDPIWILK